MNAPSVDIKDYLESSAISIANFGVDLFIGKMPDSPDSCICIYDTGGEVPDNTMEISHIMIHIRDREGGYQAGYTKAKSIYDVLSGLGPEMINGTNYVGVWAVSSVIHIGYDDRNRPLFSVNFRIQR